MKPEKSDQTDEGYVEQRYEEPAFMKDWSDDRKAEFAYQILLCIPVSKTIKVIDRLSPLLQRDFTSLLPNEIAMKILYYLDIASLTCMSGVSKHWKALAEDQALWKVLFFDSGWLVNQSAIDHFLSSPRVLPQKTISSIPLARTTASLYDPTTLPTMPGAPLRTKTFKRPTDLFFDKILRHNTNNTTANNPHRSNNRNVQDGVGSSSVALRPTHVYPSRSQPLSSSQEAVSQTIVERPFHNRPSQRRHNRYDETAVYHYREEGDTRFINWKRLYRNRHMIEKRWQEGKCKMKQFPPSQHVNDMLLFEEVQHNSGIYCLQFDNSLLVTGSRDRNLKMWDITSGRLWRTLEGHSGSVLCLQFDHRYIISGSSDATLIVWDIHSGHQIKTLQGHGESVLNVKLLGNTIVSCSKDRTVRTWDLEKGVCNLVLRGHRAAVNAVQFKGDRIVSASGDRTIKIWDMNTGECLRTLDSHSRGIACVEYDGEYIVSGSSDQSIKVWNAITGDCIHTLVGHTDLVRTLQLNSKTKTIVSGSYDGSLKIWSLDEGKLIKTLNQTLHGRILNLQFDFSKIICCSNLGKIVMYDFTHGIDTQFLL